MENSTVPTMELFTEVKQVLSQREDKIRTLDKSNEEITSLCRTLIDCVKQTMRNRPDGLSYEDKQDITKQTNDLTTRLNNELEIHNKCQEELMNYEERGQEHVVIPSSIVE
tara:strand:+ start:183 stop:515 length:333 start_codon:yes stop_codon:yes gene_type:complete